MDSPRIIVTLRGSALELHALREQAREAGLSLNNYVRQRLDLPIITRKECNDMRKRTNANVPAKGRLRDFADRLWSLAVRNDWNHHCAVCGAANVESHHMVPRQFEATRYNLQNGIALCSRCHQFDPNISPHQNAAGWCAWLNSAYPNFMEWYLQNRRPAFDGTKNAAYYCAVIRQLKQYVEPHEFVSIVGVKFAAWLEEQGGEEGAA